MKWLVLLLVSVLGFSCSNPDSGLSDSDDTNIPTPVPTPNDDTTSDNVSTLPHFEINDGILTVEAKIDSAVSDRFAYRVFFIDMNHDSKKDMLVSSYYNRRYGEYQGLVYVYLRNDDNSFNNTYSYIITPPVTGGIMFGASFMGIDWNGDGVEDLLVGAPGDDQCNGTDRGAIYVYYGDSSGIKTGNYDTRFCNTNADVRYFGISMGKFDVDADGVEELFVGAPYSLNSYSHWSGRVYVMSAGANSSDFNYFETSSDIGNNAYFGQSILLSDVNGDGFKDLLVGTPSLGGGRVFVFLHNGVDGFDTPHAQDLHLMSAFDNRYNYFGISLAATDLDGDGHDEILVSNPGLDRFANNAGAIEVFKNIDTNLTEIRGSSFLVKYPDSEIPENSYFSYGISTGDFDGDGDDEVFVQVFRTENRISDFHSKALIFSIASDGSVDTYSVLNNSNAMLQSNIHFGTDAVVFDIDGDGIRDLIVSAENAYTYPLNASVYTGAVFIYKGIENSTFESTPNYVLYPYSKSNAMLFGHALAGIDLNGDGYKDLLVGAPADDTGGRDRGVVYVYFGGRNFDLVEDAVITNPKIGIEAVTSNYFGSAIAVGDINHDGHDDLLISASYDDVEDTNRGVVYIWRSDNNGNVDYTGQYSQAIYPADVGAGDTTNDQFGASLAIVDVNPSGSNTDRNDILIGVPGDDTDGGDSGRVYIVYGADTGDGDNDFPTGVVEHISDPLDSNSNYFAYSLAVGDYNGDGISDLAIGALYEDYVQYNSGSLFVYRIRSSSYDITSVNPDIVLHDNFNNPRRDEHWASSLGFCDINGDGKEDLLIGVRNYSVQAVGSGILHIETELSRYE